MSNCKNCGNTIQSHSGRRPREFCDNNQKCRNEWFRKNKKDKDPSIVKLPDDFINCEKIGIIKADGTIEELKDFGQLPEPFKLAARAIYECRASEIDPKAGDTQEAHKSLHDAVLNNLPKKEKEAPVAPENNAHKLWREGDPKENSAAFFMKYGAENYTELQKQLK